MNLLTRYILRFLVRYNLRRVADGGISAKEAKWFLAKFDADPKWYVGYVKFCYYKKDSIFDRRPLIFLKNAPYNAIHQRRLNMAHAAHRKREAEKKKAAVSLEIEWNPLLQATVVAPPKAEWTIECSHAVCRVPVEKTGYRETTVPMRGAKRLPAPPVRPRIKPWVPRDEKDERPWRDDNTK